MSLARFDVSCSLTTVWISKAIVNSTICLTFQHCCFLLLSKLDTQGIFFLNKPILALTMGEMIPLTTVGRISMFKM